MQSHVFVQDLKKVIIASKFNNISSEEPSLGYRIIQDSSLQEANTQNCLLMHLMSEFGSDIAKKNVIHTSDTPPETSQCPQHLDNNYCQIENYCKTHLQLHHDTPEPTTGVLCVCVGLLTMCLFWLGFINT